MLGFTFIRKNWNMTADDVAKKIGVKRATVSAWERNKYVPKKRLDALSILFNGLDKEYFSKQLNEADKLKIQYLKVLNSTNKLTQEDKLDLWKTVPYDSSTEILELYKTLNGFKKSKHFRLILKSFFNAYKHYSEKTIPEDEIEFKLFNTICKNELKIFLKMNEK